MAARLASSGRTSTKPRLKTMVCPIVKDSIVEVIKTRQRTARLQIEVICNFKIVNHRFQNLIHVAVLGHQAHVFHLGCDVVFGLAFPSAFLFKR